MFKGIEGPLVTVVLDGVGEVSRELGNAVAQAPMPCWDRLRQNSRFTTLRAHGKAVGLPSDKDMGNSEVGHNVLGSGQVVDQGAKLVQDAIASDQLFAGDVWQQAVGRVKQGAGCLHFMGLLSDGNVHSHIDHLLAMLTQAAKENVCKASVHVLLDGRDVSPVSAHTYLNQLQKHLDELNQQDRDFRIASGGGRMHITMDRYEAEWDMVARGWQHHVLGEGRRFPDALTAVETFREEKPGIVDQDLPGFVIADGDGPVGKIEDGDSVIFFNFRGDRAVEITQAFEGGDDFDHFERGHVPDVFYAGMMQYDGDLHLPKHYLVGPPQIENTLSEFLIERGVRMYAISETQKYGHVTYFWNGNRSGKLDPDNEAYVEITSDLVPFDQRPWMKAAEITDALTKAIQEGKHQFLRVNYANGDMVGHTGNLDAAVTALACLDIQLRRLMEAITQAKGVAIITADHGNCEEMYELDKQGNPVKDGDSYKMKTSHSLSRVPFVLFDPHGQVPGQLAHDNNLGIGQVAATISQLLGYAAPNHWHPTLLRSEA